MAWSEFLTRLIEAIDKHLGRFSNARLIVKDAHAEATAQKLLAQADRDAEDIRSGKMSLVAAAGTRTPENTTIDELTYEQRIVARLTHQELRKDKNIQSIVAHAAIEGESDRAGTSAEVPDDDLLARIFNEAQYVSNEELQEIWGRLLAGAVSRPEVYTVDVVDFLRKLNSKRAQEIARMGPYLFVDSIVIVERIQDQFPEGLGYWLKMQHYGLIDGAAGPFQKVFNSLSRERYECSVVYGEKVLILTHDVKKEEAIKLKAYVMTELGRQVISLGKFDMDLIYLRQIAESIKKKYPDVRVMIGDVESTSGNSVRYTGGIEIKNQ